MTTTRQNPIVRLLPSLTDLAFLMPIVFLFVRMEGAKSMLGDGDTGWHIRTGEWIMANGRVPVTDIFSFTKAGQTWYAWEWLWDVCFAWLYHHGGLATVVAASILVLCVTFALLFRLVRRHCENPFIAMAATFLACAASSLHWLARPHLFTLLFIVLLLNVLDRVNEGRLRLLIVLPFMTILWTNLHGGFFVEFIILGGYIAGEIARALFTAETSERSAALHKAKCYVLTAAGCAVATFINPYTYHLHAHIIQFFREPYHVQNISEYQSISFHQGAAIYLESLLLLGAISAVWFVAKRKDFVPLVMIVGWGHLALFAARNVPLFAIIAAPLIARAINEMLGALAKANVAQWLRQCVLNFSNTGLEFGETDRQWRLHGASVAGAVLITLLLLNPNATGIVKPEYDPQRYPAKALSVLRADANSRIFADDEWGDYLVYNLYPEHKVFVDGRDDFYGQDFEQKYLDVMNLKYDWEHYLNQYQIDTIVLSTTSGLATVLKESCHWRPVYDDTVAIIFKPVSQRGPEEQGFSTAVPGGKVRDRGITKTTASRDPRITGSKPRKGA